MSIWAKSLLAAVVAVTPLATQASIIQNDFNNAGDNLLTYDDSTNLSWLDWNYTSGESYDDIFARTQDVNDELYGFRYATRTDWSNLTSSLGLKFNDYIRENTEVSNARTLQNYLGTTVSNSSFGISGQFPKSGESDIFVLMFNSSETKYALQNKYNSKTAEHDNRYPNYGHALVKDFTVAAAPVAEVPEPESFAIFALGLAGLMLRKKKKAV